MSSSSAAEVHLSGRLEAWVAARTVDVSDHQHVTVGVQLLRELVAQVAEAVALLTQHAPIHGGIELDGIAQRPERAEQRRVVGVVRLGQSLGRRSSRLIAERRGIDQRVA